MSDLLRIGRFEQVTIKLSRSLLLLVLFVMIVMSGMAQEADDETDANENPLLAMLARVPNTPSVREVNTITGYADYRAIEEARGIETPTIADFEERTELSALWIAATNGLGTGFRFQEVLSMMAETEPLIGFSFFDIDRSIVFGNPPVNGNILQGDFDPEAVNAAYSARGYEQVEMDGVNVWCGAEGCDEGMTANLANRAPADPFGGQLGRSEPVAFDDTYIYNSVSIEVVEQIIAASNDDDMSLSLAGNPDYSAAARALISVGTVRQAMFMHPLAFAAAPPLPGSDETVNSYEDIPALPPASLVVLGDTWEDDEQIALIGLVYNSVDDATAALDVIEARIAVTTSLVRNVPYMELLEQRGMTISDKIIFEDEEAGRVVGLLEMRYPMPTNEPQEDSPRFIASGLGFRLLIDGIYQRDLSFLAVLE